VVRSDSRGKALRKASLADGVDVLQKLHRIKRGWVGPPGFGPCSRRIARSELRERVGDFLVRAGPEQIDLARMIAQEEATVRGHNELLRRVLPRELRRLRDGREELDDPRLTALGVLIGRIAIGDYCDRQTEPALTEQGYVRRKIRPGHGADRYAEFVEVDAFRLGKCRQ